VVIVAPSISALNTVVMRVVAIPPWCTRGSSAAMSGTS